MSFNPSGGVPDATSLTKGVIRLSGDFGGTATAPTIPALATKANTSHNHDASYYTKAQTAPVVVLDQGDSVPVGTPTGAVVFYRVP